VSFRSTCLIAGALLASIGAAGSAQAGTVALDAVRVSARPATTGPALFYTIHVTITDKGISISRHDLPKTYSARFDIRNVGTRAHSFTLGNKLDSNVWIVSRVVPAKSHAVAYFVDDDSPGVLRFYSISKGDRTNKHMQGVFTID
jgi:hypothetical protein